PATAEDAAALHLVDRRIEIPGTGDRVGTLQGEAAIKAIELSAQGRGHWGSFLPGEGWVMMARLLSKHWDRMSTRRGQASVKTIELFAQGRGHRGSLLPSEGQVTTAQSLSKQLFSPGQAVIDRGDGAPQNLGSYRIGLAAQMAEQHYFTVTTGQTIDLLI